MTLRVLVIAVLLWSASASAGSLAELQTAFDKSMQQGQDKAAATVTVGEQLLTALVKAKGERSREVVRHLQQLAMVRRWAGDRDRAAADLRRAARTSLVVSADDDSVLAELASDLEGVGELTTAEPLRRRVLVLAERPGTPASYLLVRRIDELATLIRELEKLDEALALRKRYVTLAESLPESQSASELPPALIKLSTLYAVRRELADAEATARRALAVTDRTAKMRPGDVYRSSAAQLLSLIVAARGAAEEARGFQDLALLVHEEAGAGFLSLTAIAQAALERGELDEAAALAERARALGGERSQLALDANMVMAAVAIARGDRDTAEVSLRKALELAPTPNVLQSLASLYLDIGERARGESLILAAYNRSKESIRQRNSGALGVLRVTAQAAEANGRTTEAVRRYRETFDVSESFLRSVRLGVQEDRLLALLDQLSLEHDQIWSVVAAHPKDREAASLGLAVALLRKGRALDELAAASQASRSNDPEFQRLVTLRRELARVAVGGFAGKQSRAALEREITTVERTLRASGRQPDALPGPTEITAAVRKKLGSNELLVEIVTYQPVFFAGGAGKVAAPPRYLAFVLGATRLDATDLGPADAIDKAVQELRARVDEGPDKSPDDPELHAAQHALYDSTLGKLGVDSTAMLTVSLDGALQLVPFEITRDGKGELIDRHTIRYVTSGRDLLSPSRKAGSEVRLIADPMFSKDPLRFGTATIDAPEQLPYTRAEADDIAKLFKSASVYAGDRATSDALLGGTSPRILHVATHGVFLDDEAPPTSAGSRGVELVSIADDVDVARPNPMLRSALLLARAPQGESVLTAYRLADAKLDATELVVLSACETGLGVRKRNQGVFGLRRALLVAGASTVVTSLWRVSDKATRDLMVAYYKKLLAGRGRVAALRDAALETRKERPHPYYWGGFVAVGSAAPLGH